MPQTDSQGCDEECRCIFQCGNVSMNETYLKLPLPEQKFYEDLQFFATAEFVRSSECCWCVSSEVTMLCQESQDW